ncbi:hypothetical protein BASA81_001428 [Batrachochytrium salamandrivorans]|nr:hypothetical protein BASA81_001428 [Batrachochytrium salamandrivorans]
MLRTIAARTALGARRRRASLSTSSSVPATPAPKSSFELDDENAYWAYELCPVLMQKLGPTLGVPIDPATLKIDTNVLGPRDIRDLCEW